MREALSKTLRRHAEKDGRGYPDWATRYLPILRTLKGQALAEWRILEIGANANGFARFARAPVIAIDIERAQLDETRQNPHVRPVMADIAALPVRDRQFDLIVCMDTFEHLPEAVRDRACASIVRALRPGGRAVIGFPSGQAAVEAEMRVRARYRAYTGGTIRWLEEHDALGLPDAAAIADSFRRHAGTGFSVRLVGNTNVHVWEWMWHVLMCGWPGRGNALFQVLLRWSVPVLSRLHGPPCYRMLIWLEAKPPAANGS
ncbi:MAG: class I SAM-dependent methyltransferase [Candidatus Hydrogenedentes bacterium]|nr:class I SAM-dependent methyltransferase [Candidatus Hydrogenedentota bacterium]